MSHSEMTTRTRALRHEFDRLGLSVREVCSCVFGSPPSSPLQDDLQKVPKELFALTAIAAYHGASTALSAVVQRHPELDLAGLNGDLSTGQPYGDALVVARKLEPIASKIARGLTFAAVRNIRRAERELDVIGGSACAMADASSTGGSAAPSSSVDPPLQR
jgi:hypothetical protein